MPKYLKKALPIVLVILMVLVFSGCGEKTEEPAKEEETPEEVSKEAPKVIAGMEVLAPFFDVEMFSAKWAFARIVTPASEKTKDEYEVKFLIGTPDLEQGEKQWTKDIIIKSHMAKKDELKVGMVIITTTGNSESAAEAITDTWSKGVISSIDELDKNISEVAFYHNLKEEPYSKENRYLHNIYIIDVPKP